MTQPASLPPESPTEQPNKLTLETPFSARDLLRLVIKHALLVLTFLVIVPVVVGFYTASQPKVYEAGMTIVFDWSQPKTLGKNVEVFDPYNDYMNKQELLATEFQIVTSMKTARQVALDAGLDRDREFLASVWPKTPPEQIKLDQIAAWIAGKTRVELVRGTHIARVQFEDTNPARAQRMVAQVVDTYIRMSTEDAVGATGAALEWLTAQLSKLQTELEASETSLHTYKKDRNLVSVSFSDQSNLLRGEIAALNEAVTAASIKRAQLTARAAALGKITEANPDDIPASELLSDHTLQELRGKFVAARTDFELLTTGTIARDVNHPDVQAAQTKRDDALRSFLRQVRNIQGAALREAQVVTNELGSLKGLLETAKSRALDLNLQEIEYSRLQRSASTNEKMYQNILERMKEVDISRMVSTRSVKVLDPPQKPGSPVRPKMSTNILIGVLGGLVLGLAFAFLRERADSTLKTPHDVETRLFLPSLGLLPTALGGLPSRSRKRRVAVSRNGFDGPELIVHFEPTSAMAEAARAIRSSVLFMSPDNPPRLLLVTSSGPAEGKTTCATAIAITMAQTGARVLLVDMDLRRPRLHRIFKSDVERGVTKVLLGEPLENCIQSTPVDNLTILPAGAIPPNPAELLLSEKMKNLLAELASRYDRVVIDSSPVNPVTDTVILSRLVDGTLFVARSFETTLEQAKTALRSLLDVKAKVLGVIVNAVDLSKAEYRYRYYRSYGGYGDDRDKRERD